MSSATMASPISLVLALPWMSAVRTPASRTFLTAASTAVASSGRQSEYLSIMLMDRMAAIGLTTPLPEMSGAEPVRGGV